VFSQASVGTVDQGILEGGPHDGGLQIVGYHLPGYSAKELKGVDVTAKEGDLALVQGDLAIDPAGMTKPP